MTTSKQNNFAVDLADWERIDGRKLASNIISTSTAQVKRSPATYHNQSVTTMTTPNIAVASHIAVNDKQQQPHVYTAAAQDYVVLAGEQQNTSVDVDVIPHRDNTFENDSKIKRVKCINRSHKNLQDEDLDEIIKEMETSTVLMEVKLQKNRITLANGRFTTALASNTSLLKINLQCNKIGDEGAWSLCAALKVNNTLR
jgi:hypothetical protein